MAINPCRTGCHHLLERQTGSFTFWYCQYQNMKLVGYETPGEVVDPPGCYNWTKGLVIDQRAIP